ncbi:SH3 domain-containing protein [Mycena filopes]|nr:SH3 domain-containing protein [Mycena filopes]
MGLGPNLKTGLFPAGYVKPNTTNEPEAVDGEPELQEEKIPDAGSESASPSAPGLKAPELLISSSPSSDDGLSVTALWDYVAEDDREISMVKGDVIKQVTKFDPGWWLGVGPSGKKGLFPAPYVEVIERG